MAQQSINLGSQANDGTGDSIRDAFDKVNSNFTEVYTDLTLFNSVFSTGTDSLSAAIATVYSVTATMANFSATQALFQSDLNDVANVLVTKFDTITPVGGTGIGISNIDTTGPTAGFTVVNLGVTSLLGSSSINVSASTGTVTLSNTGVTGITGSTYLGVSGNTGSVTLTNLGVQQLSGSSYINVSASTGSVTINNTGVTDLTGGSYIGVSAGTGSVTINNLGVQSISGSGYINVSASTGTVTIENTGVKTLTAGTDTQVSNSTGTVTLWNNSTLQTVTDRGATTTQSLSIGSILTLAVSTAAPASPAVGMFAVADRVNWDPAAKSTGTAYPVFYDGIIWNALY